MEDFDFSPSGRSLTFVVVMRSPAFDRCRRQIPLLVKLDCPCMPHAKSFDLCDLLNSQIALLSPKRSLSSQHVMSTYCTVVSGENYDAFKVPSAVLYFLLNVPE